MKSAATALLEMFGIQGGIRPAKIESILVSLLYTLNKHGILADAISDIDTLTTIDLEATDNMKYIKSVTSSKELVGLYNKQKSMQLLLQMLPEISMIQEYGIVEIPNDTLSGIINRSSKSNRYREVKKLLQQINELSLGYCIVQPPAAGPNEFHIIKAITRKDIIAILHKHGIQTPSVLDALLKGVR